MNIVIDKEFQSLIPALTTDEYRGLEESILSEGCRDALVLWGDTLIDGHNRYKICTEHNIPFKTVQKTFESKDEVFLWMIDNQITRRNLEPVDRILLAQRKAPILEKLAKAKQTAAGEKNLEKFKSVSFVNNDKTKEEKSQPQKIEYEKPKIIEPPKPIHVREEVAKIAGVSNGTVAKFEQVQKKKPEMIESIRKGDVSINQAYNKIKLEEKKETVRQAEQKIAEQATNDTKPILYIRDSIGYKPTEKYDLLLTDPPYSTDIEDIDEFVDKWLYNALDGVKDTGFAYVFIGAYPKELKAYLNAKIPDHIELCQQLVWTYKNTLGNNPKDKYKQNYQSCLFFKGKNAPALNCPLTSEQWAVQEINAPDGRQGDRYHAWQKPMEIAERFIRHSTKSGDIVYDPFACTGTFLLAAAKLGRKASGCEINPDNAAIAVKRGCVINE